VFWWDKVRDIQKKMIATFREVAPGAKWIDEDDAKAMKVFENRQHHLQLTPAEWKEFQKLARGMEKVRRRERRKGGLHGEAEGGIAAAITIRAL
jgi:hypothetical protein